MNWPALARAIVDRRVALGFPTREAFVTASGLSSRLIGDLERHRRDNYDSVTLARLERALRWPAGRVRQILESPTEPPAGALSSPAEIARHIARDDLVLVALLERSGLSEDDLFRVILRIRGRREQQSVELLTEVAAMVRDLGGVVPDPVYPPLWLVPDADSSDAS